MEQFLTAVDTLLDCLWDSALASALAQSPKTKKEEFIKLLTRVNHSIAARKLAGKKAPGNDKPIQKQDIASASGFLKQICKNEQGREAKKEELEKLACLQRLDDRALGILAVLCTADDIFKHSIGTVKELVEGVRKIATWSHWPDDPKLAEVVRQQRPPGIAFEGISEVRQPASSSAPMVVRPGVRNTAVMAQPTRFDPAPPSEEEQLLVPCRCGAKLRLLFAWEQATDGPSPTALTTTDPASNPPGATSVHAVAPLAAAHTASVDRSSQSFRGPPANAPPLPITTCPAAAADATLAAAQFPGIGVAASEPGPAPQPDAPSAVASQALSLRTAAPQPNQPRLAQPPRSQPSGTEHQDPAPRRRCSVSITSEEPPQKRQNVADREQWEVAFDDPSDPCTLAESQHKSAPLPTPRPVNTGTQHPIEWLSKLMREASMVCHSSQPTPPSGARTVLYRLATESLLPRASDMVFRQRRLNQRGAASADPCRRLFPIPSRSRPGKSHQCPGESTAPLE
ncbi:hypothetical protein N657DRAFT_374989 [Parathielavia appendiculata]|uniref:Uncharacterized protein n=1 Tax=Parathielavia appendiculata TaxID=2587402 RepID=A0AAN6TPQ0_9PEZI|nr:hypothetical protein N657DRAFT_374989 [Parathielavia appendiculata]